MTDQPPQPPSDVRMEILVRDWKANPVTQSLLDYLEYSITTIIPSQLIRERNNPQETQDNISRLSVYRKLVNIIRTAEFVSQTTTAETNQQ